ncbi:MAG: isoprenylcysteine carboxylmethyltransferase family protein [Armatimonadota bacterium]|nr:isoprenylcysteine carboxylmethyltransferase family protein [Armatimonadota bacterium]
MTNYAETDSQLNVATQRSLDAAASAAEGYHRMLAHVRAFLVRRRTFLGLLAAFILVAFARPTPALLACGAFIMAAAYLIRLICAGYLDKDKTLVTGGPFGWCRNPLYLANLLVVVAFGLMSGRLIAVPILLLLWLATHAPTVACEEDFLREKFGTKFERYCRQVARWLPKPPNGTGNGSFCWKRVIDNGEHLNIISAWIVAAMFFIELVK